MFFSAIISSFLILAEKDNCIMKYIKRHMEDRILELSKSWSAILADRLTDFPADGWSSGIFSRTSGIASYVSIVPAGDNGDRNFILKFALVILYLI